MNQLSESVHRRKGLNSVAKQQIVAKPIEHEAIVYACVVVKIGIFIAFIDWQVQLDKRYLLQRLLFPDAIYFQPLVQVI